MIHLRSYQEDIVSCREDIVFFKEDIVQAQSYECKLSSMIPNPISIKP